MKKKTNQTVAETEEVAETGAVLTIDGVGFILACDFNTLADHEPVARLQHSSMYFRPCC